MYVRKMTEKKALSVDMWLFESRDKHLTVGDITELKKGEEIKILVNGKYFWDIIRQNNPKDTSRNPEEFFRANWITYIHEEGLQGKIVDQFGGSTNFEFDLGINIDGGLCWYPLKEQCIYPTGDYFDSIIFREDKPIHYTKFDKSTRVGRCGPMISWDHLKSMPKVHWP